MRLPAPLLRRNPNAHKNEFGHALIMAGSPGMLGAAALCGLAAMRSGAGLTTLAIPKSLNLTLQEKISPVIMTLPLPEVSRQSLRVQAYKKIKTIFHNFQSMAIGPGLGHELVLEKVVLKIIQECPLPLVIDARALSILSKDLTALSRSAGRRVLTPHLGEMKSLSGLTRAAIEKNPEEVAKNFAKKYRCVLLLKGHRTVVASPTGEIYINRTGNAGMATAGSGDVLTGMIAAFLAQGIEIFEATKTACYLHGKAGDVAAQRKGKASMIATDIIDAIPSVLCKT
jgi:hydroxyethylthiazole kinase-like uncharacterized protein yjeF